MCASSQRDGSLARIYFRLLAQFSYQPTDQRFIRSTFNFAMMRRRDAGNANHAGVSSSTIRVCWRAVPIPKRRYPGESEIVQQFACLGHLNRIIMAITRDGGGGRVDFILTDVVSAAYHFGLRLNPYLTVLTEGIGVAIKHTH